MRKLFAKCLLKAADKNKKIILVTPDFGFNTFDEYIKKHPKRYVNVGIAEQFAIDFAMGLSIAGMYPVVYGIASFITARAYEQIKILGHEGLNCFIVGAGGGYDMQDLGYTHAPTDDIALMRLIPGMNIMQYFNETCFESETEYLFQTPKLYYVRIR